MGETKYILFMKQKGYGCDYTIGCGIQLIFLDADNLKDAKEEAKQTLEDYGAWRGEDNELNKFLVMEVLGTYDFLQEFYDEKEREDREYEEAEEREKELAELRRLQEKYK